MPAVVFVRRAWPIVVVLIVSMALAVGSMRGDSATDDEPAHIAAGYLKVARGDLSFYRYNPPLGDSLVALPLLVTTARLPQRWWTVQNPWDLGRAFLYRSGNDADRLLFLARLPTLALFLLLIVAAASWADHLSGHRSAALAAGALVAFCPTLLAHGHLATVDVALALLLMVAVRLTLRWLRAPTSGGAALVGLAVGAGLLIKISAMVLAPWILLALLLDLWRDRRAARWKALGVGLLVIGLAAGATVELFYLAEMSSWWVRATYPALAGSALGRLAIPFREYAATYGVIHDFVRTGFEKPQYLLGAFSPAGWWYYYPVALLLKTTLPALLLVPLALLTLLVVRPAPRNLLRGTGLELVLIATFLALLLAASMSSSLALGVRYVLPIYPFLYVLVAVLVVRAVARATSAAERRALACTLVALVGWHAGEAIAAYPNYIGYFNELIGARSNADRYLIDSNLDWGQDLARLARWVDAHHVRQIDVDYFGGADVRHHLGDRARVLAGPDPRARRPGYVAVSKHFFRTSFVDRPFGIDYEQYLAGATHVATIGSSIDVWWIPPPSR